MNTTTWTSDQPLTADATDAQMVARANFLEDESAALDQSMRDALGCAFMREFAAACVSAERERNAKIARRHYEFHSGRAAQMETMGHTISTFHLFRDVAAEIEHEIRSASNG